MRSYQLQMKDDDISPARMRELKAFCEQYEEKKKKLRDLYFLSSPPFDAPTQGGTQSNPTEKRAIKAQALRADVTLIDRCLQEASGGVALIEEQLKRNVVRRQGYNSLGWMPCGRRQFFAIRRSFFWKLNRELSERGSQRGN